MSRRIASCSAAVLLAIQVGSAGMPSASAQTPLALDCAGDLGNPTPGSAEWARADSTNRQCAAAGLRMIQSNPAVSAAIKANSLAGAGTFTADPFRAPHRWAGKRGSYQELTFKHRDGSVWAAALFGPRDLNAGPYPGVLLICHACGPKPPVASLWYWTAQALAEAGYVVFYAAVGGNNVPRATEATDFLVSTPTAPAPGGEFNPWHASVDRSRLAVVGHSGAAGVALSLGHSDQRYDAIVAWDPAGSYELKGVTPRVPTLIQVADYRQEEMPEKPTPSLPKFTFFDAIRTAGVDVMQVSLRASTHFEWGPHFPADSKPQRPYTIHGEMVATYYTLAWLDRYLYPSRASAALRRLTASGSSRFDKSADVHSIGAGFFDVAKATRAGNDEAGNVPIRLNGLSVRNLLSFHFLSKYFLNGGKLQCADVRTGCGAR